MYHRGQLEYHEYQYLKKAYAIAQPGVTSQAIKDFLQDRHKGSPTATIVALYKEFIKSDFWKRLHLKNFEVSGFRWQIDTLIKKSELSEMIINFIYSCKNQVCNINGKPFKNTPWDYRKN